MKRCNLLGSLLVVLVVAAGSLYGQFFPMGPAGFATLADSSYLAQAESLGANWAWVDCIQLKMDTQRIQNVLDEAHDRGINVLLSNAGIRSDTESLGVNISNIAGGKFHWFDSYSLAAPGDIGRSEPDDSALDGVAWAVSSGDSGWFQTDTTLEYLSGIWDLNWGRPLPYNAYFRLRADTAGMDPADTVCSLAVTTLTTDTSHPHVESLVVSRVLLASDFPDSAAYVEFRLQFNKWIQNSNVPFRYKVYWFGHARKLWSDCVRTYDKYAYGLIRDSIPLPTDTVPRYQIEVTATANTYGWKTALFRYYMADEPFPDQMLCCGIVNGLLQSKGINWTCDNFSEYVQKVHPAQIYLDCYELMGRTYPSQTSEPPPPESGGSQRTPVDHGDTFQWRLDYECQKLAEARAAANGAIPIWYTVQAFGQYLSTNESLHYKPVWDSLVGPGDTARSDESVYREPTPREFRCMAWLALAYGAKGLDCMQLLPMGGNWYWEGSTEYYWLVGLMGHNPVANVPRGHRALFDTVRALNSTLTKIAPTLLNLYSVDVGQWNGATIDFITGCTDTLVQLGTFYDETHTSDKYFIVVNRHCLPTDTISPTVTISATSAIGLCDEVTGETLYGAPNETPGYVDFSVWLPPGGGRLFRLIPVIPGAWTRLTDVPPGPRSKSVRDGGALAFAEDDTGFDDAGC